MAEQSRVLVLDLFGNLELPFSSLSLDPQNSECGVSHRGEEGRIEVFFVFNLGLGEWTFFVVGPAEEQRGQEGWFVKLRALAWSASGSGGRSFSLYLWPDQVEILVGASTPAKVSDFMIPKMLEYIKEGLGDKTGPP